jgi:GT2 family glycosyltransferase
LFRDRPGVVNSTGLVLYRDGRAGDRHLRRPDGPPTRAPAEVFGGCGASLLLTRQLLDDVGTFDPALFMYYEDLDLCWRARLRGWKFVYAPDSVALHVCGGSARPESPFLLRQTERNRALVNLRNAPAVLAVAAAAGMILRAGRLGLRFLVARRTHALTWGHVTAIVAALVAVLTALPTALGQRYGIRVRRRRVPDRSVTRFMEREPRTRRAA